MRGGAGCPGPRGDEGVTFSNSHESVLPSSKLPGPAPSPLPLPRGINPMGLGHLRDSRVTGRGQRFGAAEVEGTPCCLWSSLPAVWQC